MLEDTSGNGTFVNDALVGRNNRRELRDGDEVSIIQEAYFYFKYPKHRMTSAFKQNYVIMDQLGKGHFATVYLGIDKTSGQRWAIKKFDVTREKNRLDGLQQEIAVLMGISHPSLLCLKGAFDEDDGVYLILELAPEGELFNLIVLKQKLSEAEARKVFVQLFHAIKYLVSLLILLNRTNESSMSVVSFTETLNPKTSCSQTKTSLSKLPTLAWQK
jgi:serine/threonine-protein kinase CHEK2